MSLTPLDESDKRPREGGSPADEADTGGRFRGVLRRVRDALGRVAAALTGGPGSRETTATIESRDETEQDEIRPRDRTPATRTASGSDARAAERSLTWADEGTVDRPGPSDPVDRPELVASWDDRGLTLSEPGDSGAEISSDTWIDIER